MRRHGAARSLGGEGVVVTFAALALAAEDDGRGQEQEGGGDQQEQAEPCEDPDHLQGAEESAESNQGRNERVRSIRV